MNRGSIRERVKNYLAIPPSGDGQITDDRVNGMIDDAISRISAEYDWPHLLLSASVSFATVTGLAAQPTNFSRARELIVAGNIVRYATLREYLDPIGRENNYVWTVQGANLLIDPIPTTTLAATLWYYRSEPQLTTDTQSPLLPPDHHPLICAFAAHLGWLAKGDTGRAQTWYAEWEQGMKATRAELYQTFGPRRIVTARREPVWATWV